MNKINNRGQAGIVFGVISIAILLLIGIVLIGKLHSSSVEDCTEVDQWDTLSNSTRINNTQSVFFTLTNPQANTSNLTISYQYAAGNITEVYVSGNILGTLDGTSPDTFTNVTGVWITATSPLNITYRNATEGTWTNITYTNLTYHRVGLETCAFSQEAYDTINQANSTVMTSFTISPYIILVLAGVAVMTAILALSGKR